MKNEDFNDISFNERLDICEKHLDLLVETHGEVVGTNNMRKHFGWYFKKLSKCVGIAKKISFSKELFSNEGYFN